MQTPPPIVERPAFYFWMVARDLTLRDVAAKLETTAQTVQLIMRPFDDPRRRVPQPALMQRIEAYTAGEIDYASFIEPRKVAA